jgi:hypothetical protein
MCISKLISNLNKNFYNNHIFKSFDIKHYNFDLSFYNINFNKFNRQLIFRNKYYEIYLIVWNKGHFIDYHDHPKNGCHLKVLKGELLEKKKVYQPYLRIFESQLKDNNNTFASHDTFHSIKAIDDSVSIHIYSPPLYYEDKN